MMTNTELLSIVCTLLGATITGWIMGIETWKINVVYYTIFGCFVGYLLIKYYLKRRAFKKMVEG